MSIYPRIGNLFGQHSRGVGWALSYRHFDRFVDNKGVLVSLFTIAQLDFYI